MVRQRRARARVAETISGAAEALLSRFLRCVPRAHFASLLVAVALCALSGAAQAQMGTVTSWDVAGTAGTPPANLKLVVRVAATAKYALGLKKDGSLVAWNAPGVVSALPTLPAGPFADIQCDTFSCLARRANGTLAAVGSCGNGTSPGAGPNLTGIIFARPLQCGAHAIQADGTLTSWGSLNVTTGNKNYADFMASTSLVKFAGSLSYMVTLDLNGIPSGFVWSPDDSKAWTHSSLGKPPNYAGFTDIVAGDEIAGAVAWDGTAYIWGSTASALFPGGFVKKVRKLVTGQGAALAALMTDGKVTTYGNAWQPNLKPPPAQFGQLSNVFDLGATYQFWVAAQSSACGGISPLGCCQTDFVQYYCDDAGNSVKTACPSTCGWLEKGGNFADGAWQCTSSSYGPMGTPVRACGLCQPDCTGKSCGDDGCGGSCGTCVTNTSCTANKCVCTLNCSDANTCTDDTCDAKGCINTANTATCSTGSKCTSNDKCAAKVCTAGPAVTCNDSSACTTDSCNAASGCVFTTIKCDDGNACTNDTCSTTAGCQYAASTAPCNDGNACTTNDTCGSSKCTGGAALNCDDSNPCTNDSCSTASGCAHANNTVACTDNNACTQNDACANGACKPGAALVCNDNNPCTTDNCDSVKGCTVAANTLPCSDSSVCTVNDVCAGSKCQPGAVQKCDDNQVCTSDTCDAVKGCQYAAVAGTPPCDDGNTCNSGDHCEAGKCTATSGINCDDNNPCTDDPCDGKGGCNHTPLAAGSLCDDGNPCTTAGNCVGTACSGIVGSNCDDGNPCTVDACAKATGCIHTNSKAPCDDGNPCSSPDVCNGGICTSGVGCGANAVCTQAGGVGKCVCKSGFAGDGKTCTTCVPTCAGKKCGSDGCGGQCGTCSASTACNGGGQCVCQPACAGKQCGGDGCGGSCGSCSSGSACNIDGVCSPVCATTCAKRACGGDGCGGTCGTCADGQFCNDDGKKADCRWAKCPATPSAGCCTGNTASTCGGGAPGVKDCSDDGLYCGWNASKGGYACMATATGADPSGVQPWSCSAAGTCTANCKGKACGPDGCGGSCGTCADTALCNFANGQCVTKPCPDLPKTNCCAGDDVVVCSAQTKAVTKVLCGSGASACGWDGSAFACGNGLATAPAKNTKACPASLCIPNCQGKNCGSDGCGGSCGSCAAGAKCQTSGQCCAPNCTNRNCGSDGCGGSCGTCASALTCNEPLGQCTAGGLCQGAPYDVGCCAGQTLKFCSEPMVLTQQDCSKTGGYCGWDAKVNRYTCDTLGGGVDPKGAYPLACKGSPPCQPNCQGKACGPDGCGGTCPSTCTVGQQCDNKGGKCISGCKDLEPVGCCHKGSYFYCGLVAPGQTWSVQSIDCKAKGMGCGYNVQASHSCVPGTGWQEADGTPLSDCPASVTQCQPDCSGKTCGPDGCGGSCGNCTQFELCESWSGQCYVPPPDCKDTPTAGKCVGTTLTFCSAATQIVTQPCGKTFDGKACVVDNYGQASCFVASGKYPNTTSCAGSPVDFCGSYADYRMCQCDAACTKRGDCCGDFLSLCSLKIGVSACGDKVCNTAAGETCENCADCKGQCVNAPPSADPPWPAPFGQVLAMPGKPVQQAQFAMSALDQLLPSEPPVPLGGLLTHIAARGVRLGPPATHVTFGAAAAGGALVDAPGKQGASLGLAKAGATTAPSFGKATITLESPLPALPSFSEHKLGGVSLALWVKLPADAPAGVQPLVSTLGAGAAAEEVCGFSRLADATVQLACPTKGGVKQKIVSVYGYYGSVEKPLAKLYDYPNGVAVPYAGLGDCARYKEMAPTHACAFSGIQEWLQSECLGKTGCQLNAWQKAKDPCVADLQDPKIVSSLFVRALCAADAPPSSAALVVESAGQGRHVRLDVAGMAGMATATPLTAGVWHHVALAHRAYLGVAQGGVTTLYLDGHAEASSETVKLPTFGELWVGAMSLAGPPPSAPNVAGNVIASVADVDDVFVYDRALSQQEVRAIWHKPLLGLLRVWPAAEAAVARQVGNWWQGKAPTQVAIEAPRILGAGANTVDTKGQLLRADHAALRLQTDNGMAAPTEAGDLSGLASFTVAGWLRVPGALSAVQGKALVKLSQLGKPRLVVQVSGDCGGATLVAAAGDGVTTPALSCEHGLAANRWAFVSAVVQGGTALVRIDGHPAAQGKLSGLATLLAQDVTQLTFEAAGGVDVAWVGLFDGALPIDQIQRWRSQGPAVWMDGGRWNDAGAPRVRDLADFELVGSADATQRRATAWGADGKVAALTGGDGPLPLTSSGKASVAAVTVPALGRFAHETADTPLAFTFSGRVDVSTATLPLVVPLLIHRKADGAVLLASQLRCVAAADAPAIARCRVEGTAAAAWSSAEFDVAAKAGGQPNWNIDVDVALATSGELPSVAVGSRLPGSLAGQTLTVAVVAGVNLQAIAANVPSGFDQFVVAASAASGAATANWRELRWYPRAVTPAELRGLVARSCAATECASQACVAGGAAAVPACGPCAPASYEAGDKMGNLCLAQHAFYATCTSSEQCATGQCVGGRCQAATATAECAATCGALNRACVPHTVGSAKVYGCSEACLPHFSPPIGDPVAGTCLWTPSVDGGKPCTADVACLSGHCIENDTPSYSTYTSGATVGGKFCAHATAEACTVLHRDSIALKTGGYTGKTTYKCTGCKKDTYNGQPIYKQVRNLISLDLCTAAYQKCQPSLANQFTPWFTDAFKDELTLDRLGRQFLDKKAPLEPTDLAKLRKLGIGPGTLAFVQGSDAARQDFRDKFGTLPLSSCRDWNELAAPLAGPYFSAGKTHIVYQVGSFTNPFHDPDANGLVCVGNQFANGAPCPPPGSGLADDQGDAFCESGFCARDSHVCETGFASYEDTQQVARQDSKASEKSSEYGPFTITQSNRASLQVRKIKTKAQAAGVSATAPKRAYSLSTSVSNAMSIFGSPSFDVSKLDLTLLGQMDDQAAQYAPHLFLFGVEQPQVKSLVPPSLCSGSNWKDFEYVKQENCGVKMKMKTLTPTIPQITFCPPVFEGCKKEKDLPKGMQIGPTCIKRSTFIGPIPVAVEASLRTEVCFNMGLAIDGDTFEPAFKAGPEVDVGVEVKGGVGTNQFLTVFAGVKAQLSLLKVGFPVTWALKVEQAMTDGPAPVEGLFRVKYSRDIALEASVLKLMLALFTEVGLGPLKFETEYKIFEYGGLNLSIDLGSAALMELKLDLKNPLADQ